MPLKRLRLGEKLTRRLEFSAVLVEISKRLVEKWGLPYCFFGKEK